jgi:anaerobic selenocysteine-containing dehydrogenase
LCGALFVVGGNPVTALPDVERIVEAFRSLDVLAVSDVVHTDTTALATHVFPCAGQLERSDLPHFVDQFQPVVATQYAPAVFAPGAERKPMWWPFAKLAERLGVDVLASGTRADTVTDDELLAVLADRSRASFADLQASPTAIVADTAAFGWVEERLLPEGRWRIAPAPLVAQLAELREPAPLVLLPRRQLRHLNSQLRDPVAAGGRADTPEILVHPADAAQAGIVDGDRVAVVSADGSLVGDARVDDTIRRARCRCRTASPSPTWAGSPAACMTSIHSPAWCCSRASPSGSRPRRATSDSALVATRDREQQSRRDGPSRMSR